MSDHDDLEDLALKELMDDDDDDDHKAKSSSSGGGGGGGGSSGKARASTPISSSYRSSSFHQETMKLLESVSPATGQ